jgi:hypothetical protein
MVRLLQRWGSTLVLGVGIWVLSLPLLFAPAPTVLPAAAGSAASGLATAWDGPRQFRSVRPPVVIGQLVVHPIAPDSEAPATAIGANWISIPRLGIGQPVGWYSDCMGSAPVPRRGAWRWSCAGSNNTYIMAHNPGVFTPILALHVGDLIEYGDPHGAVHDYRVVFTTIVGNAELWPLAGLTRPSLTLQTCWTVDGSRDFIVRAIQI